MERPYKRLRWGRLGDTPNLKYLIGASVKRPSNDASTFLLVAPFHIHAEVAALEADGAVRVKLPALIFQTVRLPLQNAAVLAGNIEHFAGVHRANEWSIQCESLVISAVGRPHDDVVTAGIHIKHEAGGFVYNHVLSTAHLR